MNAPFNPGALALQRRLSDVAAEYDHKKAALDEAVAGFHQAGKDLQMAATVAGVFGNTTLNVGHVHKNDLELSLLRSAWKHVYEGLNIAILASPNDKRRFEHALTAPAPFTIDNIRGTFGAYVADPRASILRSLAEVFCGLDPFYRSHEKMKVGVKGLPKRVIIGYVDDYGSYGKDKIEAVLNALAAFEGKPLVTWREIRMLLDDEDALLTDREVPGNRTWTEPMTIVGRGVRLRRFANKNGHLFFEPSALRSINLALSEYYGTVIADCADEDDRPDAPRASTAVSRDLQYYPTPVSVVQNVVAELYRLEGARVLEPSCGCGRFMDALRAAGADVTGIEVDPRRAAEAAAKGHRVQVANFLQTEPQPIYDRVVMNPPFYGKHYAKHVAHALEFLKPGGTLTAVLPATAQYDHGLVDGSWRDLPVGSFSESGTNVNTCVLTIGKAAGAHFIEGATI